jgi:hypothetical protein
LLLFEFAFPFVFLHMLGLLGLLCALPLRLRLDLPVADHRLLRLQRLLGGLNLLLRGAVFPSRLFAAKGRGLRRLRLLHSWPGLFELALPRFRSFVAGHGWLDCGGRLQLWRRLRLCLHFGHPGFAVFLRLQARGRLRSPL